MRRRDRDPFLIMPAGVIKNMQDNYFYPTEEMKPELLLLGELEESQILTDEMEIVDVTLIRLKGKKYIMKEHGRESMIDDRGPYAPAEGVGSIRGMHRSVWECLRQTYFGAESDDGR